MPYHTCAACMWWPHPHVGGFPCKQWCRIPNQVSLPPSPDPIRWPIPSHPIHRAPVTTRGPPASTRGRCRLVHPSGGPVHPTRSQVPRHEPASRRDDARRPRRLGFRSIPCWAGPRPHTWWANICSPARDGRERDGTGDNGRRRPQLLLCLVPPVLHMRRQRRHLQRTDAPSSPRWRSPPAPPSQAPR
jgi:hypothetical protein